MGGILVAGTTSDAGKSVVTAGIYTDALWRLAENGAPVGLPFIPPGAP